MTTRRALAVALLFLALFVVALDSRGYYEGPLMPPAAGRP
jgi:hypothetical protein